MTDRHIPGAGQPDAATREARRTSASRLDLLADIGGTNSRFALSDPAAPSIALHHVRSLRNADYQGLDAAIADYLDGLPEMPSRAAIGVASPVADDEISLTNLPWSFRASALRQRFGFQALHVVNDFGALAHAVPVLGEGDWSHVAGPRRAVLHGPVSVIGPGTGLGVALLVGSQDNGWHIVDTEGGHASFAPLDDSERAIEQWLRQQFGRVSIERVLCGEGLSQIDAVLRAQAEGGALNPALPRREPAAVSQAALSAGEPLAQQALSRFCAILGSVAGDMALTHGARTLVIAGGIVPRFLPFLRGSDFHRRFRDKGRMAGYLDAVSIHVITHPHPGLLGAACLLRRSHTPTSRDDPSLL